MTDGAGVVRSADSLIAAGRAVEGIARTVGTLTSTGGVVSSDRALGELANLVTAARSLLSSALVRCETRGAHARSDHPVSLDRWRRRIVHRGDRTTLLRPEPPIASHTGGPADSASDR